MAFIFQKEKKFLLFSAQASTVHFAPFYKNCLEIEKNKFFLAALKIHTCPVKKQRGNARGHLLPKGQRKNSQRKKKRRKKKGERKRTNCSSSAPFRGTKSSSSSTFRAKQWAPGPLSPRGLALSPPTLAPLPPAPPQRRGPRGRPPAGPAVTSSLLRSRRYLQCQQAATPAPSAGGARPEEGPRAARVGPAEEEGGLELPGSRGNAGRGSWAAAMGSWAAAPWRLGGCGGLHRAWRRAGSSLAGGGERAARLSDLLRSSERDGAPGEEAAARRDRRPPREGTVLLFPGQGSHFVGMGRGLLRYPGVRDMYRLAEKVLGYDLLSLCLEGPRAELDRTQHCQPAVFVASLAAVEKLNHRQPDVRAAPGPAPGLAPRNGAPCTPPSGCPCPFSTRRCWRAAWPPPGTASGSSLRLCSPEPWTSLKVLGKRFEAACRTPPLLSPPCPRLFFVKVYFLLTPFSVQLPERRLWEAGSQPPLVDN